MIAPVQTTSTTFRSNTYASQRSVAAVDVTTRPTARSLHSVLLFRASLHIFLVQLRPKLLDLALQALHATEAVEELVHEIVLASLL